MKRSLNIAALLAVAYLVTSVCSGCKKYENGGSIRKAEDNLTAQTWKLESYYRNGNNETSELLISNFTETFTSDNDLIRSYTDTDGDAFSETGTWQFDSDKMQINITGVGSVELTEETSTVSTSDYNIEKLDKEELWYSYSNGGDLHEFRMVPN